MKRLSQSEQKALEDFAKKPPLENPVHPPMPIMDFLKSISSLPKSMRPEKPVNFDGKHWKI